MKNWKSYFFISLIAIVGSLTSYLVFRQAIDEQIQAKRIDFYHQSQSFYFSLKNRFFTYQVILKSLRGFFLSSEIVDQNEWQSYVSSLALWDRFPSIELLGFVQKISKEQMGAEVEKIRSRGTPDFKIWPVKEASVYLPVVYTFPQKYSSYIGLDLNQDSAISEATKKARSSEEMILTDPIELSKVRLNKGILSLLIPINKSAGNIGWIVALINFKSSTDLLARELGLKDVNYQIYRGKIADPTQIIVARLPSPDENPIFSDTYEMTLGGVDLTLVFSSGPGYKVGIRYAYPTVLLLSGLLTTLLLMILIYFAYKEKVILTEDAEKIEQQGAQACSIRQALLNHMNDCVICSDEKGKIVIFNKAAEKLLGYKAEEVIGKTTPVIFHDPKEMDERAKELSTLFGRQIAPGFEVFAFLAQKGIPDEKKWHYIRKDQSRVAVSLNIQELKNNKGELIGFMGISHETQE
ncbi:MAG: hypothetical protein COT85_06820 [Chlamydiae bacterium CG10_big_fil_rev_8_21_14_0_10_42_34]|nr:MAG: hypothetical protein COT85_06820 [Chlamydiae bacterium CG10_big_fil_rev_8_21_14_0_10_42_34]